MYQVRLPILPTEQIDTAMCVFRRLREIVVYDSAEAASYVCKSGCLDLDLGTRNAYASFEL